MSDSPFNLSSLCSTPLFGGMDFLGCPVNASDDKNMEITEFLDPGEFSISSESEDEIFERRKVNLTSAILQSAIIRGHDELAVDLVIPRVNEARIYQEPDKIGLPVVTNWPGSKHSEEQQVRQNELISEEGGGLPYSQAAEKNTSVVNTSNGFKRQNLKNGKLSALKGHFSSPKKLNSRYGNKDENGKLPKDNEGVEPPQINGQCCTDQEEQTVSKIELAHNKIMRAVRRKQQLSKAKLKPLYSDNVVSKSNNLSFVSVNPAWSYSNSPRNTSQVDKYREGKYDAIRALGGDRTSALESTTPITRGKTESLTRALTNSVSLPVINTQTQSRLILKQTAKLKLPGLSQSKDVLLKYSGGKHLELIEGKSIKATNRLQKTSQQK